MVMCYGHSHVCSAKLLTYFQVGYSDDETSQLARQAFLESLVTNASHVFQDTSFAASYGQPQVQLDLGLMQLYILS